MRPAVAAAAVASNVDAVLPSASIPLAFPPVRLRGVEWVDGGVPGNVPIRTAIEAGAKEVVVLLPDAKPTPQRLSHSDFLASREPEADPDVYEYRDAASDLVDVIVDSQLQADLEGVPHGVTVHVLRPGHELGHTLDFRPAHIREMLEIGRREAVHWLATTSGVPKPR